MDPAVIFPQFIFEKILNYVTSKELLNFTTVSKSWHDAITTSWVLMSRFHLSIREDWVTGDDRNLKYIESCSKRTFQKVIISDLKLLFKRVYNKIMLDSKNNWKVVEIHGMTVNTRDDYINFINTFESSVQKLVLSNIFIHELRKAPLKFNFKNLRDLRVSYCDKAVTAGALYSAQKIVSLEMQRAPQFEENNDDLFAYIKDISTLETLELRGGWFNRLCLNFKPREMKFQLKELKVACIDYVMPNNVVENFQQFLEEQRGLVKISLSDWFGLKLLNCILSMPKLKELTVFISPFFRWGSSAMPQNKSLEILDVRTLDVNDELFNLLRLISSAPNLKKLCLRSINPPLAHYVKVNLKSLTTISLVHSTASEEIKSVLPHVEFV